MKTNEFLRLLSKNGINIQLKHHGGSHDIYYVEKTNEIMVLPRHQSDEIKPGLLNKLMKQAGLK